VSHGIFLVSGFLLLGLGCLLVPYASRQRALDRRVGSFACRVQRDGQAPAAWTAGVAQYGVGRLVWYRDLSLSPRPVHTWKRSDLELLERDRRGLMTGSDGELVRLRCRCQGIAFNLTVSSAASAGLTSWIEAGPASTYRHSV